jgi:hypothetical protein
MNPQWTRTDDLIELYHSQLTAIVAFERASRTKAACVNGKHQSLEKLTVSSVERNIQEN